MKKKKSKAKKSGKKKVKTGNWLKQHKPLIIIALIVFLFLAAFGTKGFLYLNFILGNDIIIHLDADKEDLKLVRGEEESISFKASITTNPFCNAQCKSYFEDISRNNTIENNTFKLSPGMPITKEYKIKIDEFGEGQKLYRFGLECRGSANFLCHTKQESTSRNILVTVEHSLRDDERELKNSLKHDLNNLKQKIEGTATKANEIEIIINGLDNYVSINETKNNLNNLKKDTSVLVEELNLLAKIWDSQNYYELNKRFDEVDKKAVKTADMVAKIDKNVSDLLISYNSLAKELNDTRERLKEIKGIFILDKDIATEINDNINVFNSVVKSFNSRNGISKKRVEVNSINYSVYILYGKVKNYQKREYFEKAIEIDINYDILCSLNISCVNRPSINERANQTNFELKRACDGIENLRNLYLNISVGYVNQSTGKIDAIKGNIAGKYLDEVPENQYNSEIIKEILLSYDINSTKEDNLSSDELYIELVKDRPKICKRPNTTYYDISNKKIELVNEKEVMPVKINVEFNEPVLKCCVFGECNACCVTEECINDPLKFPVVFVHGHSVNENTAADYSLDAFNKLQKELEKDGYLNAGSISLYTPTDNNSGIWGLPPVPVSIKASYYFDIFREPENYLVVQTKNENIDTYALRLGEIIETVKYKTGKPKVMLIAHSMGGLVSRRYLQIFGEDDVEKLIMIGTPNHGIEGNIAHICPIIGGKYACRDMLVNSLFLNKLNRGELPDIDAYMIIGKGCDMGGQPSDGTVLVKNARLEGEKVRNFVVNGSCDGLKKLHSKMLDPKIHPEVYDIVIKALKDEI